jgi:hypothetical protein
MGTWGELVGVGVRGGLGGEGHGVELVLVLHHVQIIEKVLHVHIPGKYNNDDHQHPSSMTIARHDTTRTHDQHGRTSRGCTESIGISSLFAPV